MFLRVEDQHLVLPGWNAPRTETGGQGSSLFLPQDQLRNLYCQLTTTITIHCLYLGPASLPAKMGTLDQLMYFLKSYLLEVRLIYNHIHPFERYSLMSLTEVHSFITRATVKTQEDFHHPPKCPHVLLQSVPSQAPGNLWSAFIPIILSFPKKHTGEKVCSL